MDKKEAREQLSFIQGVLERSTQYTNISSASAYAIGVCGTLAGAYSEWILKGSMAYQDYLLSLVVCWGLCFILAVSLAVFFSVRRARKSGEQIWVEPIRQALSDFVILFFIGGILTAGLMYHQAYPLIPSVWMLAYGGGIYIGCLYSIRQIRFLGLGFLSVGALTLFYPVLNQIALMSTFGIGHLILGIYIQTQYEQKNPS